MQREENLVAKYLLFAGIGLVAVGMLVMAIQVTMNTCKERGGHLVNAPFWFECEGGRK